MARIHLNWSGCCDWHAARARLRFLSVTVYGNFADVEGDPHKIRTQLEARGFTMIIEPPGRFEDVRFRLYDCAKARFPSKNAVATSLRS